MAEYSGSIDLISGIRPKNNGKFPLVNAKDVQVDGDGTRLDAALATAQATLEQMRQDIDNITPGDDEKSTVEASDVLMDENGTTLDAAFAAAQEVILQMQKDIGEIEQGNVEASDVVMDENGTTLDLFATQASQALVNLALTVNNLTPITMTESEYAAAAAAGTIDENKTYYVIGDGNE